MNFSGANLDHAKRYNRRLVLEIARRRGPLSRADVTRITGLSPQTISNITDELRTSGLLRPVQRRPGRRGDPTVVFEIDPEGGYTFGLSFDHDSLLTLLADVAGTVRDRRSVRLTSTAPKAAIGVIEQTIARMLTRKKIARSRVWGVGMAVPGLVQNGELVMLGGSALQSWVGFPMAQELQSRLGLAVQIENDATASAIGERFYGTGKDLADFVYIYFGVGIGAGLFLRGQPYRGGYGKSGEIAHLVVEAGGRPCPCGNRGCLERYASLSAAQALLSGRPEGEEPVNPARLTEAFLAGDKRMLSWVDEAAEKLRSAIVMIENFLDPQTIILGGIIQRPLLEAIAARLMPLPRSVSSEWPHARERIMLGEIGIETPALGAAMLPIFEGITPELSLVFKDRVSQAG